MDYGEYNWLLNCVAESSNLIILEARIILSRRKKVKCLMKKKIRVSIRLQLERSFSILTKQKSKLMEGVFDIWCRGQEKGLCQSLENLSGTSMGCGFIKNSRATGELFQIRSSICGKPFNMEISIVDSQLLQMLKFCQNGNGEVVVNGRVGSVLKASNRGLPSGSFVQHEFQSWTFEQ
jgi:hypothetical protein